jgi:hypothetical protein
MKVEGDGRHEIENGLGGLGCHAFVSNNRGLHFVQCSGSHNIKGVDTSDWTPVRAAVPETGIVGESTCTPCPLNF